MADPILSKPILEGVPGHDSSAWSDLYQAFMKEEHLRAMEKHLSEASRAAARHLRGRAVPESAPATPTPFQLVRDAFPSRDPSAWLDMYRALIEGEQVRAMEKGLDEASSSAAQLPPARDDLVTKPGLAEGGPIPLDFFTRLSRTLRRSRVGSNIPGLRRRNGRSEESGNFGHSQNAFE